MKSQPTHRFAYLDGIRGIAALFVLLRHTHDLWSFSIYRSYLAVDIFFVLSGFVIASAYGEKMATGALSSGKFILVRLIRLYPMYFISLLVAVPVFIFNCYITNKGFSTSYIIPAVALSMFFLPASVATGRPLFPVNGPSWSVFYELLINLLYAAFHPFMNIKRHIAILLFFGVGLYFSAATHGNLDVGFQGGTQSFIAGIMRSGFGIFTGILLFNYIGKINITPRPYLAILLICMAFFVPSAGKTDHLFDFLCVTLLFPACVILAATTTTDRLTNTMLYMGASSYPIYLLHKPAGQILSYLLGDYAPALANYSGIACIALILPTAVFLERKLDEPIRRWLIKRFVKKPSDKERAISGN